MTDQAAHALLEFAQKAPEVILYTITGGCVVCIAVIGYAIYRK